MLWHNYPFVKPEKYEHDKLLEEIWKKIKLWPQTLVEEPQHLQIGFRRPLTIKEFLKLEKLIKKHNKTFWQKLRV